MLTENPASAPDLPHDLPRGLSYVSQTRTGYSRKKHGKNFQYYDQRGKRITDSKVIERINGIGIPPAYTDVWICPTATGHIQATGIDARGRKQYRYHSKWREVRDENKFQHILQFGAALPALRARVAEDMKKPGLSRDKVLATVVELLEKTLIRVGNAEYAKTNDSYGLTTLRDEHVTVKGSKISFQFTGKSGKSWNLAISDRRIANIVKKCADIPGYELFKYLDSDGQQHDISSADVNAYLHEVAGADFTAKDFRTWSGTILAALALQEFEHYNSTTQAKRNIKQAIEHVAKQLGNTPTICRKCYIHPEVISSYLAGDLAELARQKIDQKFRTEYAALTDDEILVLAFLKKRLAVKK